MIAHDRGWLRRLREAVDAAASPPRRRSSACRTTRAPSCSARPTPICATGCTISTISPTACCTSSPARASSLLPEDLPENAILVARSMGPAALLDYDRARLRGLVLEDGGAASHIAIVARALGIPAVSDVANISEIVEHGRRDHRRRHRPAKCMCARRPTSRRPMSRRRGCARAGRSSTARCATRPRVTRDGVAIGLHMNAGLLVDLPHLDETGADSIGLFRTELQFMLAPRFPRLRRAGAALPRVLDAAGDRPVTFRTLDIGGDKILPYMKASRRRTRRSAGARSASASTGRRCCASQMRAMLRAGGGRELRIMFPMVSTVDEFSAARGAARARARLPDAATAARCRRDRSSASWSRCPRCCGSSTRSPPRADFLSVGSNDLMQYLFAADRDNKRVVEPLRHAVAGRSCGRCKLDRRGAAERTATPVTLCGEIGGRPLEAMALIALGFRDLSMSPASIGPVKAMVLSLDAGDGARRGRGADRPARRRAVAARAAARLRRSARRPAVAARAIVRNGFHARPRSELVPHHDASPCFRNDQPRSHPAPPRGARRTPRAQASSGRATIADALARICRARAARRRDPRLSRQGSRSAPISRRCSPIPRSTPRCGRSRTAELEDARRGARGD